MSPQTPVISLVVVSHSCCRAATCQCSKRLCGPLSAQEMRALFSSGCRPSQLFLLLTRGLVCFVGILFSANEMKIKEIHWLAELGDIIPSEA